MKIKLISYSKPAERIKDIETMNDIEFAMSSGSVQTIKDLIVFAARVSNPANQSSSDTGDRLIAYLAKHKHWSPFEMASLCLEIETTRDIARQILRHRSFSFQEFSQRYANPKEFRNQFVLREARLQDIKNRQNSTELEKNLVGYEETSDEALESAWRDRQQGVIDAAREAYDWAIDNGIAKEQARCVLPEGNTKSRLYMNGTIRSWIHYIELRSDNGTQKEHRDIAVEIARVIGKIFPLSSE